MFVILFIEMPAIILYGFANYFESVGAINELK